MAKTSKSDPIPIDMDAIRARGGPVVAPIIPLREFSVVNGGYVFGILPPGIRFVLDHVRREKKELIGELSVQCDLPGARITPTGGLFTADFNLSHGRTRTERAKILADRSRNSDIDWLGYLNEFCEYVFESLRHGEPVRYIADADPPAVDAVVECDGIPVLRFHPMILFGDGGSAKSLLALKILGRLVQLGERVLYLDWELDIHEHRDRLERLFGPAMPKIAYLNCWGTLPEEMDRIQQTTRQEHISYVVFDSIGFACPQPEASESALAYLRATRSLGIGSLHIAHINRSDNGDQKPFGSSFWHNGARSTWFVDASDEPDQPLVLALHHRKANTQKKRAAIGFSVEFQERRTVITRTDVGSHRALAKKLTLVQQMMSALKRGPKTAALLADELEAKAESVSRKARAYRNQFVVLQGEDGIQRIALAARGS
jgi:hypothetical protein